MRLIDCFVDVIAYTAFFLENVEGKQPRYDQVKSTYKSLLSKSKKLGQKGRFSNEDYDLAKFAICAWVDESLLCSKWEESEEWKKEQLQRIYYDTVNAGEEFFDHLDKLPKDNKKVLEVFLACLSMGFRGRYFSVADTHPLEEINSNVLEQFKKSYADPGALETETFFPGAYSGGSGSESRRSLRGINAMTIVYFAGPITAWCIMYYLFSDILNSIVAAFTGTNI